MRKIVKISFIIIIFLAIIISGLVYFYENFRRGANDSLNLEWYPDSTGINYVFAGDVGITKYAYKMLKNIELTEPELIFWLGDIGYSGFEFETYEGLRFVPIEDWFVLSDFLGTERMKFVVGNHDDDFPGALEGFLEHYGHENEIYSFEDENIHFLALSTELPNDDGYDDGKILIDSEQYNFINEDLKKASSDPNIDWIIVMMHRPMYAKTSGESLRESLQPLFDLYKVDFVIQAHWHFYERSMPLKYEHEITSEELYSYINPNGQIYLNVGSGGCSFHYLFKQQDWSITENNHDIGFLNMKLQDEGTRITGEFINNKGIIQDKFQVCLDREGIDKIDFSEKSLVGQDLRCMDLSEISLSGKDLSHANLAGVDLSDKDLSGTILVGANLADANLAGVDLSDKDLSGTILVGANLADANLTGVDLSDKDLSGTILIGTDITENFIRNIKGTPIIIDQNLSQTDLILSEDIKRITELNRNHTRCVIGNDDFSLQ